MLITDALLKFLRATYNELHELPCDCIVLFMLTLFHVAKLHVFAELDIGFVQWNKEWNVTPLVRADIMLCTKFYIHIMCTLHASTSVGLHQALKAK
jgi:hypothetical protein